MRLTFDDEDEDAFFATREALLDEIVESLSPPRNGAPEPEQVAGAIGVLLDWRWNYSTGQLDDWAIGDTGHATMFLLDHGLATADELGSFIDIAPMVDVLATALDEPSVLCELFVQANEHAEGGLLDELWHHDQPETIEILSSRVNT